MKWLGNEGRDPARWLALAPVRARKALEGNDPIAVRNAVAFLPDGIAGRDMMTGRSKRCGRLPRSSRVSDQTVVQGLKHWAILPNVLASYGPAARPYVQSMIDQAKQRADLGRASATWRR